MNEPFSDPAWADFHHRLSEDIAAFGQAFGSLGRRLFGRVLGFR
ncbi:MAG: hypothetical protein ABI810_09390 [Sphingomonas bacterium]